MTNRNGKIKLLPTGDYPITVLDAVKVGNGTNKTLKQYLNEKIQNNGSIVYNNRDSVLELKNLNMIDTSSYTTDSRGWKVFDKIEVEPNRTYAFYFLSNWSYFEKEDGTQISTNDYANPQGAIEGTITVPSDCKYLVAKASENNISNVYLSEFLYSHTQEKNIFIAGVVDDSQIENLRNYIMYGHLYGKKLYCIGDSTTQGTYNYHRKVADKLYMTNLSAGVGGARYSCGTGTNESSNIIYNNIDMDKLKNAEVLTIMAGCNDISNSTPIGTFEDRTLETFYGAMHLTIQKILQVRPDIRIGLITPFPKGTINGSEMWEKCKKYNDVIKGVAGYYQIPVFDGLTESGMAIDIGLNGTPSAYEICKSTDSGALEVVTTVTDSGTQIAYDDVIKVTDLSKTLTADNKQYVKVSSKLMYNNMLYDGTHATTLGQQTFAGHLVDFIGSLKVWNRKLD